MDIIDFCCCFYVCLFLCIVQDYFWYLTIFVQIILTLNFVSRFPVFLQGKKTNAFQMSQVNQFWFLISNRTQVKMGPTRRSIQLLDDDTENDEPLLNHSQEEKREVRNKIEVGLSNMNIRCNHLPIIKSSKLFCLEWRISLTA